MQKEAMEPHGLSLLAYFNGDSAAEISIHRDDGKSVQLPVGIFFCKPAEFTPTASTAIKLCKGHVLDIGAGSGLHSLVLQKKGIQVTAIDICAQAVNIMRKRGIKQVYNVDIFRYKGGPFDTLMMIGHGIGMVENIAGLDQFLIYANSLLKKDGQILLDSLDVRKSTDPTDLSYHEANRQAGRYIGEIRMKFEFAGKIGPICGWLHVDANTLQEHAKLLGWQCEVIQQEESGDYLAKLTRSESVL
jgi:SAM-dependent methyltransferase